MSGASWLGKKVAEMGFNSGGGAVNWFPGHMAAATRAIRDRLKLADLVIEVRDARIPLSSANGDLQQVISTKRRVIALNKKDLANPNIMRRWVQHFESRNQDCLSLNAHSKSSVNQLLSFVELKLKEAISREPTLLVMVVGVPNVGKSALINAIHRIAASRFPEQQKLKRATVGPLPGVTQDIAGYKIASQPSIYVLDTPGILVPSISDIETGLKLALTGSVKDSVVGEERLAQYLLSILNTRKTPLYWERLHRLQTAESPIESEGSHVNPLKESIPNRRRQLNGSDVCYIEGCDLVFPDPTIGIRVSTLDYRAHILFRPIVSPTIGIRAEFDGNLEEENELESLIDTQLTMLGKSFRIPLKMSDSDEARHMVSKKLLTLFRTGNLGPFILDNLPTISEPKS